MEAGGDRDRLQIVQSQSGQEAQYKGSHCERRKDSSVKHASDEILKSRDWLVDWLPLARSVS